MDMTMVFPRCGSMRRKMARVVDGCLYSLDLSLADMDSKKSKAAPLMTVAMVKSGVLQT